MWPRFSNVTVTTGSRDVIINSGESASNIIASDALVIGNFQLEEIESILAGADGKTIIRLFNPWLNNSLTQPAVVVPNPGDLRRVRQALKDMEQLGIETLVALNGIATSETKDFVTIADAAGTQYQVPTASFYQRKIAVHESALTQLYNDKKAALDTLIATNHLHAQNGADMEARREQVRRITGGNGMMYWGRHHHNGKNIFAINEGMYAYTDEPNRLFLGRKPDANSIGKSKTKYPELAMAGFATKLKSVSTASVNTPCEVAVKLPPPPDGTWSWNPNRTPAFINHMTYKDPKYGGTDSGGNRIEAVARCFEQECLNGDFRNGLENWHTYGARGTATLNTKGVELVDTTGKSPEDSSFYLQNNALTAKANAPQRVEVVIESATDINAVRMRVGLFSNREYKKLRIGRNVIEFTPDIDVDGANVCLIYVGSNASCVVGSMFVQPVSCEQVISPVDMWGFEGSLQEVTAEYPYVYPNGLPQTTTATMDGVATTKSNRPNSYYAWYTGDEDSKGDSVNFFAKSVIEQDAHLNNPDNHLYYLRKADGTRGLFQWNVTGRSYRGLGNGDWYSIDSNIAHKDLTFGGDEGLVMPQGERNTPLAGSYNNSFVSSGAWSNPKSEKGLFTAHGAVPAFNGECYFWLGGTVSRLSESAYVEGLNETGSMTCNATTTASSGLRWDAAGALTPLTVAECFNIVDASKDTATRGAASNSGKIGTPASGRPDDWLCNAIYPGGLGGVVDRRVSAWAVDLIKYAEARANIENGSYRGLEKLAYTKPTYNGSAVTFTKTGNATYDPNNAGGTLSGKSTGGHLTEAFWSKERNTKWLLSGSNGETLVIDRLSSSADWIYTGYNSKYYFYGVPNVLSEFNSKFPNGTVITVMAQQELNIRVSGEFITMGVIGEPGDIIQTELKDGFLGCWISTIPDGKTKTFEYPRKATKTPKKSEYTLAGTGDEWHPVDPVISWGWDDDDNSITAPMDKGRVVISYFSAWARQTVPAQRAVVEGDKSGLGDVLAISSSKINRGCCLAESVIGKVCKSDASVKYMDALTLLDKPLLDSKLDTDPRYFVKHVPLTLGVNNNSPAVKILPYSITDSDRASIAMAVNELKHNGNNFGDSGKVTVTGDSSTYTNLNNVKCKSEIHKLAIPLPYWAGEGE